MNATLILFKQKLLLKCVTYVNDILLLCNNKDIVPYVKTGISSLNLRYHILKPIANQKVTSFNMEH